MSPDTFLIESMACRAYNAANPQRTVLWDDLPGWRQAEWRRAALDEHRTARLGHDTAGTSPC